MVFRSWWLMCSYLDGKYGKGGYLLSVNGVGSIIYGDLYLVDRGLFGDSLNEAGSWQMRDVGECRLTIRKSR